MVEEFRANLSLVNKRLAEESHKGTSFDPEKRAVQEIEGFGQYVNEVYDNLKKYAKTEAQQDFLNSEMDRFQHGFAAKYNDRLAAEGRTISSFITGGSNFPVSRAQKANVAEHKRYEEMIEYRDKAQAAILRELKKMGIEEEGGEIEVLKKKIERAEQTQEAMKIANAIIRKKTTTEEKVKEIMAKTGFREETVRKMFVPDYMGNIGFPGWQLQNNNANIRRMKERLIELEKKEETTTSEIPFAGGNIVDSKEDDRVQIFFDQKPPQEMINKLKGEGWRWSPSNMAWQRKRTPQALYSASRLTGAALPTTTPATSQPAPPAAIPPVAPQPLKQIEPIKITNYAGFLSLTIGNEEYKIRTMDAKGFIETTDFYDMLYHSPYKAIVPQGNMGYNKILNYFKINSKIQQPPVITPPRTETEKYIPSIRAHPPMLYPAPSQRPAEEIMIVPNPETLTKDEYVNEKYKRLAQVLRQQGKNAIAERVEKGAREPETTFKYETSHRDQVVLALAQGKTVGGDVLKDYPDIVARIRQENEALLAKDKAERDRLLAIEKIEENELNAELNKLPPSLKRHAETEIYGTLHLPETHKDYRNRYVIALGKVRKIAFTHLPSAPPSPVVKPISAPVPAPAPANIFEQTTQRIRTARTLEELQTIRNEINTLPLFANERVKMLELYNTRYSLLLSEKPFGTRIQPQPTKPVIFGVPTPQEQRKKAQQKLTTPPIRRLSEFGIGERAQRYYSLQRR